MLTPISTKIEEFENKILNKILLPQFDILSTDGDSRGYRERATDFIQTLLQQRDEEWRELVDNNQRPLIAFASINHPPRPEYVAEVKGYNQALDDIITKSKGDMTPGNMTPKVSTKTENWREVKAEEAEYAIILRPGSSECSVYFYKTVEDLEWALAHSWFNYQEAMPVKLLKKEVKVHPITL